VENELVERYAHAFDGRLRARVGFMDALDASHLDFLKIDIEYYEWASLDQALNDGVLASVDVLMLEVHFDPDNDPTWDAIMALESRKEDGTHDGTHDDDTATVLDPDDPPRQKQYITQRSVQHKIGILERLRALGFKQYWGHPNPSSYGSSVSGADFGFYPFFPERFPCCAELGFIRMTDR